MKKVVRIVASGSPKEDTESVVAYFQSVKDSLAGNDTFLKGFHLNFKDMMGYSVHLLEFDGRTSQEKLDGAGMGMARVLFPAEYDILDVSLEKEGFPQWSYKPRDEDVIVDVTEMIK
jgi:hypothetical protein